MDYLKEYQAWLSSDRVDEATKKELEQLRDSREAIEGRFRGLLEFGTAGLRGLMGAGLFRMNVYTVRLATQALANVIAREGERSKKDGAVIAFDCRRNAREFALEAAGVLAANGITVRIFDSLRPTPELSFAVRHFGCTAGVNITASHNPKEYNGYKVYWRDGGQISPELAGKIQREMKALDMFEAVKTMPIDEACAKGLVITMGEETDEAFLSEVLAQSMRRDAPEKGNLSVVFTPFHGTGYKLVPEALRRLGIERIFEVEAQARPDGAFPTVESPNPENIENFKMAIELADEKQADIILGTDPDGDRVGVLVRSAEGEYVPLSGNQTGALLLHYLLFSKSQKNTLPKNPCAIKTIVTTELAGEICKAYGAEMIEVLTGFKFIAEKIQEFEQTKEYSFLFGFEESLGYLAGTYARDKDAVGACLLIAEMAAFYKKSRLTLLDVLNNLFTRFGHHAEKTLSVAIDGENPFDQMERTMKNLRERLPEKVAGVKVLGLRDYLSGITTDLRTGNTSPTGLPVADVLFFEMADETSVVVRPSGTEPKVKLYILAKGGSANACKMKIEAYEQAYCRMLLS